MNYYLFSSYKTKMKKVKIIAIILKKKIIGNFFRKIKKMRGGDVGN